ncbi:MAG: RNA polymerase sigma factor [Bacteroidota bacterium]
MGTHSNHPSFLGAAIVGQETAFAQFLEDNRSSMTAQLKGLTRDAQLAEDLYQDTVLHLWEKRRELASLNIQQPKAWLWACVHNRWRAYRAREQRRQALRADWADTREYAAEVPFVSQQWEEHLARLFRRVLSPIQEQIMHLMLEGFPPRDIAQQLGISPKKVHQQIYLSRKKLSPFFRGAGKETK